MDDGINGETTDDGQQDTYERALIQLVMTHFSPGEVPAMIQRAYLGDDVMPDWESSAPLTPAPYTDAHLWELTAYGRGNGFHYARRRSTDGVERHYDGQLCTCPNAVEYAAPPDIPRMMQRAFTADEDRQAPEPQEQAAVLIPVRHQAAAVPAWRKALIRVLAAGIARLA